MINQHLLPYILRIGFGPLKDGEEPMNKKRWRALEELAESEQQFLFLSISRYAVHLLILKLL